MQSKPAHFTLNIVSPEKIVYTDQAEMVVIPGESGELGILPCHEALISALRPGVIEIYENNAPKEHIFINGGFAEVSDDVCTILTEEAFPINEIDMNELEQFIQDTSENINIARSKEERLSLENDFKLASVKLEIIKKLRK